MSRKPDTHFVPREAVCKGCGRDCMTVQVNLGMGRCQYAGAAGFYSDWQERSDCCEAAVTDSDDTERTD